MNQRFLLMLLLAVVIVGGGIFLTVSQNQKRLLTLEGQITDVRVRPLDANASLAILDFEATNPAEIGFEANEIQVEAVVNGQTLPSGLLGKGELNRYFEYEKLARPNEPFGLGDEVKAGQTEKRMVASRFEVPTTQLDGAEFVIRFINVNRVTAEIKGKRP